MLTTAEVRHTTRSSVRNKGYKLLPMQDKPEPRKKPRSAKPREEANAPVPETPVEVLQQAGRLLEIDETELTVEKLTAHPSAEPSSSVPNDE